MVDNEFLCHYQVMCQRQKALWWTMDHHAIIVFLSMVDGFMMGDGSLLFFLSSSQGKNVLCVGVSLLDAWSRTEYVLCWYYWLRGGSIIMDNSFLFHYFFVNLLQNVF